MIPNIHIHEQLMFERCQELQRETARQKLSRAYVRSAADAPLVL